MFTTGDAAAVNDTQVDSSSPFQFTFQAFGNQSSNFQDIKPDKQLLLQEEGKKEQVKELKKKNQS